MAAADTSSFYNLFVDTKDPDVNVLFNTLTHNFTIVDAEAKHLLETNTFKDIPNEILEGLKKRGFVVDGEFDEKMLALKLYNEEKYAPGARFVIWPLTVCNLNCSYCCVAWWQLPRKYMDDKMTTGVIQHVKKVVEEKGVQDLDIVLTGGEPFMHPKAFLRILKELNQWSEERKIRFQSSVVTNGTKITPGLVKLLKPHLKVAIVSIHEQIWMHARHEKNKEDYEKILSGVSLLSEAGIVVELRIVVSKKSTFSVGKVLDDLKDRGVKNIPNVHIAYEMVRDANAPGCGSPFFLQGETFRVEDELQVLPVLWSAFWDRGYDINILPAFQRVWCNPITNSAEVITPTGVYNCWVRVNDDTRLVAKIDEAGNVSDKKLAPFFDVLNRDPFSNDVCRDCELFPVCGGGCPTWSLEKRGDYNAAGCLIKDAHRKVLELQLRTFVEHTYPDKFSNNTLPLASPQSANSYHESHTGAM